MAAPQWFSRLQLLLLLVLCLTGCGDDPHQARLCQRLLGAFEAPGMLSEMQIRRDGGRSPAVTIEYQDGGGSARWLRCRFAGYGFDRNRLQLIGVATDRRGELSDVQLHMLRIWLQQFAVQAHNDNVQPDHETATFELAAGPAYLLQQLLNTIVPCCIYVLLALGFNLVHALVRRINLAYGELLTLGAYAGFATIATFLATALQAPPAVLILALAVVLAFGLLCGWLMERLVFAPLRHAGSQAPLIATIGAALAIQETIRLWHGGREHWLQPVLSQQWPVAGTHAFQATLSAAQSAILAFSALIVAAFLYGFSHLPFGQQFRACADDLAMARLCGIDADRVIAVSFALAGLLAAGAGFIVALYYGGIGFTLGTLYGLKGLTAAIIGGLGRLRGAIVGGITLALVETLWSGYLSIAWRDAVVFGLLAAVLVFRPHGLFGPDGEDRASSIGAALHH